MWKIRFLSTHQTRASLLKYGVTNHFSLIKQFLVHEKYLPEFLELSDVELDASIARSESISVSNPNGKKLNLREFRNLVCRLDSVIEFSLRVKSKRYEH